MVFISHNKKEKNLSLGKCSIGHERFFSFLLCDEDKNKTRAIGIMDNKTKKEIFVTVYSKGIQKGEYLRVRYLPNSRYGEIKENK